MLYNYVKLADDTQFAYSEMRDDRTVKVVVEHPVDFGFESATCVLPGCVWSDVEGFSQEDMESLDDFVRHNAPLIMRFAQEAAKSYA